MSARKGSPGHGSRSPALLLSALLALWPLPAHAQTPAEYMVITRPSGWQQGQAVVVAVGQTFEVEGFVAHPAGVARVLVNGVPAALYADSAGPVRFVAQVTATASATQVVITVEPRAARAFTRNFALGVTQPTPQAPPAESARAIPPPVAVSPPMPAPADTAPPERAPERPIGIRPNPWPHFALRGIGYAGVLAAGLVLASRQTTSHSVVCTTTAAGQDCFNRTQNSKPSAGLGMGLAGAALAAGILDIALTAHRAGAARQQASQARPERSAARRPRPRLSGEVGAPLASGMVAGVRIRF